MHYQMQVLSFNFQGILSKSRNIYNYVLSTHLLSSNISRTSTVLLVSGTCMGAQVRESYLCYADAFFLAGARLFGRVNYQTGILRRLPQVAAVRDMVSSVSTHIQLGPQIDLCFARSAVSKYEDLKTNVMMRNQIPF